MNSIALSKACSNICRSSFHRTHFELSSLWGILLLTLLTLGFSPAVRAQVAASIKGMVTDSSGAPVASATVTAKDTETGAVRTAVTANAGRYQIVSLAIGPYEVSVRKSGFPG